MSQKAAKLGSVCPLSYPGLLLSVFCAVYQGHFDCVSLLRVRSVGVSVWRPVVQVIAVNCRVLMETLNPAAVCGHVFPRHHSKIIERIMVTKFGTHDDPEAPWSEIDFGAQRPRSHGSKVSHSEVRLRERYLRLNFEIGLEALTTASLHFIDIH